MRVPDENADVGATASVEPGSSAGLLRSETAFALAVAAAFAVLAGIGAWRHELWRDEMGAWLLATHTHSPSALLDALRHEGHPSLWYLLLWPLTRWPGTPQAMQALHVLIAAAGVFAVARLAPGPRWMRALWAVGYFPLYEYAVIAREYVLTLLVLACVAWSFGGRRSRPLVVGALLAVLPHTSPQGWLLAVALWAVLAGEAVVRRAWRERDVLVSLAVPLGSIALAAWQMLPARDAVLPGEWALGLSAQRAREVADTVLFSWLPVPKPGPFFWGSNQLYAWLPEWTRVGATVALLGLASWALARAGGRTVLAAFVLCLGALLGFEYVKFVGSLRHHGFLWLTLGLGAWLAAASPAAAGRRGAAVRAAVVAFTALLVVQAYAGAVAFTGDLQYRFSAAAATADLIRREGLAALPLAGAGDTTATNVMGHLGRREMFYLDGERYGSYVRGLLPDPRRRRAPEGVWPAAVRFAGRAGGPVVVVADLEIVNEDPPPASLRGRLSLVGCEESQVVPIETFCVFVLGPG